MAVLGPVDWDGRCLSPGCGAEGTGPDSSPPCLFFLFCFLYASVVVNHQRRASCCVCLHILAVVSKSSYGGPTGCLPGEPGPYLRLVHRLGNGPVTCFFSLFFHSVISLGSRPILSLSQPISILKANQSECLSSLCVLWRFLPFYVAVLFVGDVTFCCAFFSLFFGCESFAVVPFFSLC